MENRKLIIDLKKYTVKHLNMFDMILYFESNIKINKKINKIKLKLNDIKK